ncbi:MAG: 4Fe-4S binding protein [Lentisphaeria bacterium]
MFSIFAQVRFPAPEFEHYIVPEMHLEQFINDPIMIKILFLSLFLLLSGISFYYLRSRKAMLLLSIAGLLIFGFIFTACPCPVGMFQNVIDSIVNGTKVGLGILLLFTLPLAVSLFMGRVFCTGACPLGAIQEILHWKTIYVPRALDRVLRMLPILLLLLFSVMSAAEMAFALCLIEPYLPIFLLSFIMPMAWISIFFLILGLFVSRPFCRYLCPYGVLLRFFTLFSVKKPQLTTKSCINCKLCEQSCPNNAILPPEPNLTDEMMKNGSKRLSYLVSLTPLALTLGGVIGYVSSPIILAGHRSTRLLKDLASGIRTQAVEAFEASGMTMLKLQNEFFAAQNTIYIGMTLTGIIFASCVMAELLANARKRKEQNVYSIEASLCFCCGRCYPSCPLEKEKISKGIKNEK